MTKILIKHSYKLLSQNKLTYIIFSLCLVFITLWLFVVPYIVPGGHGLEQFYDNETWISNAMPEIFVITLICGHLISEINSNNNLKIFYTTKAISSKKYSIIKLLTSIVIIIIFCTLVFGELGIIRTQIHDQNDFFHTGINPIGLIFSFFSIGIFGCSVGNGLNYKYSKILNLIFLLVICWLFIFVHQLVLPLDSEKNSLSHYLWFSSYSPLIVFIPFTFIVLIITLFGVKNE